MPTSRRGFLISAGLSAGRLIAKPSNEIAFAGGKVYTSRNEAPIINSAVIVRDGLIAAAGPLNKTHIPSKALVVDCRKKVIVAGFYNSHVHFIEPHWQPAAELPAADLTRRLRQMLTRWGFTSVFDLSSALENTLALRRRIEAGEITGPAIRSTGMGFVKKDGTPFYVRSRFAMPELTTPEEAVTAIDDRIGQGADGIKLFTGSAGVPGPPLSLEVVQAATAEAHRRHKLVFAHPQHLDGVRNAVEGEVDVLVHTAPDAGPWPPELIQEMVRQQMSLIPTLRLFEFEAAREGANPSDARRWVEIAVSQLAGFCRAKGEVLFGTDAGYVTEFDPSREYELMTRAGMSPMQILASLTTAPAARFGDGKTRGQVARGFDADIVVLDGDPADDPRNLAKVRLTLRQGQVLYEAR